MDNKTRPINEPAFDPSQPSTPPQGQEESVEQKIRDLLLSGIDSEKLLSEMASHFTESVDRDEASDPAFSKVLEAYPTLEKLFREAPGQVTSQQAAFLNDLKEDIDYALTYQFDLTEDSVKKDLLKGSLAKAAAREMKRAGIVPIGGEGRYGEDDVELFYVQAFREFDDLRKRLETSVLQTSPRDFYAQGRAAASAYRQAHGLLMDEKDFNTFYLAHFDRDRLQKVLAKKVYESIHFHRRYVLEFPDDDDENPDDQEGAEEGYTGPGGGEEDNGGILIPAGDMHPEEFSYVFELMNEYNGSRILPSGDPSGEEDFSGSTGLDRPREAYWQTFGDEFAELLGTYMITKLEDTIRYFNTEKPQEYASLARYYGWSREDRTNPEVVLHTCDKISFFLSDLQQEIWDNFTESPLMPVYEQGKALSV